MDKSQAYKLLHLSDGASPQEIQKAYSDELASVKEKQQSAPTDVLKQKFVAMHVSVEQAYTLLTSTQQTSSLKAKRSPLSATEMHDLPGAGQAMEVAIELSEGTFLAGRYTIKQQIGEGGMGAVYRAIDSNTGNEITLKVLLPSYLKDDRAKERFLDEAHISQQLSHPNIANVFDVQQDGDYYFLAMELLEGQDLRQVIENRNLARQPFAIAEVQEIISAVSTGLAYAHKHTVHRNIKPENIWLSDKGEYKIMDFGIARVRSTSQCTQTVAAMGTTYYMAPEQLKGLSDIDGRADQYALGVMAHELLSGEVPAGMIEPIGQHRKDTPKGMANAIHKALAPCPESRFSDINTFSEAINSKGSSMPVLPIKNLGIAAVMLIAILGIGGLASTGGLNSIWEAIKPIDREAIAKQAAQEKALLAKQAAQAKKLLAVEIAQAAKLQGEIKNYQRRLDDGRRQLDSDLRDAKRNDNNQEKYLAHWQTLTENYLFGGDLLIELEGELTMGESLLREDSVDAAQVTLSQVRDGYKSAWEQFNSAEDLLKAEESSQVANNTWLKRKNDYGVATPEDAMQAQQSEDNAAQKQRAGDFAGALYNWQAATSQWQGAYKGVSGEVDSIDRQRTADKSAIDRAARAKAVRLTREKAAQVKLVREKLAREKATQEKLVRDRLIKQAISTMVSIPSGSFQMGSNNIGVNENPMHRVSIQAFRMSQTEVTFAQWDTCVSAGGCSHKPDDKGWGRGNRPVIKVSYSDITGQFIPWLNKVTGNQYRLPSESEWEYAARAGSTTKYSWGNSISCSQARYGNWDGDCGNDRKTVAVKSYSANAFGLYDMHGNAWEWTQDCWNDSYNGAPSNGEAWTSGDCAKRIVRGGSWFSAPNYLRTANRVGDSASIRYNGAGFRLVQGR